MSDGGLAAQGGPGGGWEVPTRWLPLPDTVSAAVRESLAADPIGVRQEAFRAVPQTTEQWLTLVQAFDEPIREQTLELIDARPVSVEAAEVAGVPVFHVIPDKVAAHHEGNLFVHAHGGAFVLGGGIGAAAEALEVAASAGIRAISIDYRMPPLNPYPAALDDLMAVYEHLLDDRPGSSMALGGTSAGGGLVLALAQRAVQQQLAGPACMVLGTPATDNSGCGDSYRTNEGIDRRIPTLAGFINACFELYAGDFDPRDPGVSPIYGSFEGLPPALLVSGTRDLLLSNTVRTHLALRAAGSAADLLVFEGLSHGEYLTIPGASEKEQFLTELSHFLGRHLGREDA